ncbi:MAG: ASCH domain-containing protein [Veillonellaceae bacterium]|nr:ASCH domain-containing protein [Veillonellaceae bacterium]
MKILNFYNDVHDYQLEKREKHCSIRLGDKRQKYAEGDVVWITYGNRYGTRKKIFTAAIDHVDYKAIKELTQEELIKENPAAPSLKQLLEFLRKIYNATITPEDYVSVIYFSEVMEG